MRVILFFLLAGLVFVNAGGHYDEDEPPPQPETEEPPTEEPHTEEPPTEPPSTKKPGKGPKCIGKWKTCKKSAGTPEEKRACYEGLRTCVSSRCDTTTCDTPLVACQEKATEKQKKNLKCEKQWKKCFMKHRSEMCHKKKGGHHDEDEPPSPETEEPLTEEPHTEAPPTEPPSTKKPGKGYKCIGKWKTCKKAAGTSEEKRACYEGLRTCAGSHCDTTTCDTALTACQEKATEKQKTNLKCEKQWKKCFVKHRSEMCHKKKGDQYDEPPPPETEEPPTEEPHTEEPPTEPPSTKKPGKGYKCIGKWKTCKKAAGTPEEKRACYEGLRTCAGSHCDTTTCDTALTACQEKATEKQKTNLKCEKQWKKCFVKHRSEMCHKKKGDQYDEPPPPETEEPPTEEPHTEEPPTEPPSTKKPGKGYKCIGKWKTCKKAAGTTEEKRACYEGLRTCAGSHCDTTTCDTPLAACKEKATEKQKKNLKCEKQWKKCFVKHRSEMCHKKKGGYYEEDEPETEPPTEEPLTEEPLTEEPLTEEPITEEPPTEAPRTEKPRYKCIGKWKTCKRSAETQEDTRSCYQGLKTCVSGHCDTTRCDTALTTCREKATKKAKSHLKCEKQWKRCFKRYRPDMCHKGH